MCQIGSRLLGMNNRIVKILFFYTGMLLSSRCYHFNVISRKAHLQRVNKLIHLEQLMVTLIIWLQLPLTIL